MGKLMIEMVKANNKNSDSLKQVVNQLSDTQDRWFAIYTKYKCEKYVATHLNKKKIETYLPTIHKTRRYTRKIKHYEVPLINCYVFVHIKKSQYLQVLETEYVMKFLKQGQDLLSIPDSEIEILHRVTGDVEDVQPIDYSGLLEGHQVEVISGHLTGMRGRVVSRAGKKGFVIDLKTLGFELRINVDANVLKPISQEEVAIY